MAALIRETTCPLQHTHDRPYDHDHCAFIFIQNARTGGTGSYKTQFAAAYV